MVIIGIELEQHSEFRHVRQAFDSAVLQRCLDDAVSEHFVLKLAGAFRFSRHFIPVGDKNAVLFLFNRRACFRILPAVRMEIHTADLPLCIPLRHIVPAVIIIRCPPEVRHRNCFNHFFPVIFIRGKSRFDGGKLSRESFSSYSDVPFAIHHCQRCLAAVASDRPFENSLSKGHFMSALCPECTLSQHKGDGYGKFGRFFSERYGRFFQHSHSLHNALRQRKFSFCQWRYSDEQFLFQLFFSVFQKNCKSTVLVCIYKQIFVLHCEAHPVKTHGDILIIVFYFLHLRRGFSVSSVHNAVAAEVVICGPFPVISSICLKPLSVAVLFPDGLIYIIPDKAALIPRFPV